MRRLEGSECWNWDSKGPEPSFQMEDEPERSDSERRVRSEKWRDAGDHSDPVPEHIPRQRYSSDRLDGNRGLLRKEFLCHLHTETHNS